MSSVKDLMTQFVITIPIHRTLLDAVRRMKERRVGCLVVVDGDKPVGIITERDFVRRVLTEKLSLETEVSEVMSKPLTTVGPDSTLGNAAQLMVKNKIRRLPVVKDGKLVGIIVASDFARHLSKEAIAEEDLLRVMSRYSPVSLTPILIVNLKGYDEVLGERPIRFAEVANSLSQKYKNVTILVAPPSPIFEKIAKITPSISQHIDPLEPSGTTGYILPKEIRLLGGIGSLINHSERRIPFEDIKKNITLCKKYHLVSFVCARDLEEAEAISNLHPDFIAIEPPELIGGDISVSKARPEIITKTVEVVRKTSKDTMVICGAGIKTRDDVEKAVQLGARGIIVASGIVKTENIEKSMEDLIKGLLVHTP